MKKEGAIWKTLGVAAMLLGSFCAGFLTSSVYDAAVSAKVRGQLQGAYSESLQANHERIKALTHKAVNAATRSHHSAVQAAVSASAAKHAGDGDEVN